MKITQRVGDTYYARIYLVKVRSRLPYSLAGHWLHCWARPLSSSVALLCGSQVPFNDEASARDFERETVCASFQFLCLSLCCLRGCFVQPGTNALVSVDARPSDAVNLAVRAQVCAPSRRLPVPRLAAMLSIAETTCHAQLRC